MAAHRTSLLTQEEIVTGALRQFDAGPHEPSIRSLAAALNVTPAAIYHHFPSQSAIWQTAVERVWDEALEELLRQEPDPFNADPVDTLVAIALATRRTWLAHHRLSPYMAATPGGNQFRSDAISLMASLFERIGLRGDAAAVAFHSYATFMIGAVLYAAANRTANEQLAADEDDPLLRFRSRPEAAWSEFSSDATREAMDTVTDFSVLDPERDEELFVHGIRALIESLTAEQPGPRDQP